MQQNNKRPQAHQGKKLGCELQPHHPNKQSPYPPGSRQQRHKDPPNGRHKQTQVGENPEIGSQSSLLLAPTHENRSHVRESQVDTP